MSKEKPTLVSDGHVITRTRTVTDYLCKTCRTDYETEKEAAECNGMPVEKSPFKKKDMVTGVIEAVCRHRRGIEKPFPVNGVIVKVTKVHPVDTEYSAGPLGGKLMGMHARQYEVEFPCICDPKKIRGNLFYSVELKKRTKNLTHARKK